MPNNADKYRKTLDAIHTSTAFQQTTREALQQQAAASAEQKDPTDEKSSSTPATPRARRRAFTPRRAVALTCVLVVALALFPVLRVLFFGGFSGLGTASMPAAASVAAAQDAASIANVTVTPPPADAGENTVVASFPAENTPPNDVAKSQPSGAALNGAPAQPTDDAAQQPSAAPAAAVSTAAVNSPEPVYALGGADAPLPSLALRPSLPILPMLFLLGGILLLLTGLFLLIRHLRRRVIHKEFSLPACRPPKTSSAKPEQNNSLPQNPSTNGQSLPSNNTSPPKT